MKKHKSIIQLSMIVIFLMISNLTFAQKPEKIEKLEIKTSIQCGMCEERIIDNLTFEKGVKDIKVDIDTKIVTVTYRTDKTDPDKIRKVISDCGYDADDVPADPVAYEKLPKCCQKGGHDQE